MALDDLVSGCVGTALMGIAGTCFAFGVFAWGGYKTYQWMRDGSPDSPAQLTFAGRISLADQSQWVNDRLVLLYAQELEAGRATTAVSAFRTTLPTPTDGVFTVTVPNIYGLSLGDVKPCRAKEFETDAAFCWVGDLGEDRGSIDFAVPAKKLTYRLRVLPGDYEALPEEMKEAGSTSLSQNEIVLRPAAITQAVGWFDRLLGRTAPTVASDKNDGLLKDVRYESHPEITQLPSEESIIDNCGGTEPIHQSISHSRTFVHEYQLQAAMNVGIPVDSLAQVQFQLGARGNYRHKQISTKTIKYDIGAQPHTNVAYTIRWKEVWDKGTALINQNGKTTKLPFRTRKDVTYEIESHPRRCAL